MDIKAMWDSLEPAVADSLRMEEQLPEQNVLAMSSAISLKRIADAMERYLEETVAF